MIMNDIDEKHKFNKFFNTIKFKIRIYELSDFLK